MESIKKGDTVKWLGSKYKVIEITKNQVLLKQKFSIGTILTKPVDISEIVKL